MLICPVWRDSNISFDSFILQPLLDTALLGLRANVGPTLSPVQFAFPLIRSGMSHSRWIWVFSSDHMVGQKHHNWEKCETHVYILLLVLIATDHVAIVNVLSLFGFDRVNLIFTRVQLSSGPSEIDLLTILRFLWLLMKIILWTTRFFHGSFWIGFKISDF